jgi:polyhydroxybutyrate depolymerase
VPGDFVVGGDRPVTIQLPEGYDPLVPAPLLLSLHGYGSSPAENEAYLRVGAAASSRGLLFAAPEGTMDGRRRFWNATDACCDFAQIGTDDSAWLAEVIVEAEAVANVDPKRIYVIGHSNGGFMSHRMACDHADLVAAIVSLAGATFADPDDCRPSEPVAVLQIHGTADPTIRYEGGTISLPPTLDSHPGPYPGARATTTLWARYNGCSTTPGLRPDMLDLDDGLSGPVGVAETTVEVYPAGCRPGGHVELWTIEGGGHVPSLTADFAPSVVDFLLAHPKP